MLSHMLGLSSKFAFVSACCTLILSSVRYLEDVSAYVSLSSTSYVVYQVCICLMFSTYGIVQYEEVENSYVPSMSDIDQ